jgi:uncharacterized radical SAM superfamily protein
MGWSNRKLLDMTERTFLGRIMTRLSVESIWHMTDEELSSILNGGSCLPKSRSIRFYAPSFMYYRTSYYCSSPTDFPTISVTAAGCALKCKHCGGKVLETMYPATSPEGLFDLCRKLKQKGALGCLISGGCLPNGSVPIGNYVDTIGKIKRELDLTVLVHTGIIDSETAKALKKNEVDTALIDVIGSDDTIKEVCNSDVTVQDYDDSLKALNDAQVAFVPHVTVGLHYGKLKGELHALKIISKYKPSAVVIIAFMPIHGTEMQDIEPPKPMDIARMIAAARLIFPQTPLVLGCMRPKGNHRTVTDILALKAGVDAIAFPTEEAIRLAEDSGYKVAFSSLCCSQIYSDTKDLAVSKN